MLAVRYCLIKVLLLVRLFTDSDCLVLVFGLFGFGFLGEGGIHKLRMDSA